MNVILSEEAEEYVTELFGKYCDSTPVFHNLDHTKDVVRRSPEIAAHYCIPENETELINAAAWFHDAGYLFVNAAVHEAKSIEIMTDFFTESIFQPQPYQPSQPLSLLQSLAQNHPALQQRYFAMRIRITPAPPDFSHQMIKFLRNFLRWTRR